MKSKEIRTMPTSELKEKLAELEKELMKLSAQVATGTTPKSPGRIRAVKRTVARILTELKQKEEGTKKA